MPAFHGVFPWGGSATLVRDRSTVGKKKREKKKKKKKNIKLREHNSQNVALVMFWLIAVGYDYSISITTRVVVDYYFLSTIRLS